jgi:hypothetical protein
VPTLRRSATATPIAFAYSGGVPRSFALAMTAASASAVMTSSSGVLPTR